MSRWGRAAAALAGSLLLLWQDGWFTGPALPPPKRIPVSLAHAFGAAAGDLAARAATFAAKPEVARALEGGGIAVDRTALFASARQTLDGAPPGTWIALTDLSGKVQAWWGEAPSPVPLPLASEGFSTRWSATALTLLYRRPVGSRPAAGIVAVARSFPARAPDFARALALSGEAEAWRPVARAGRAVLLRAEGRDLVWANASPLAAAPWPGRALAFFATAILCLLILGRARSLAWLGFAAALLYLALICRASRQPRALSDPAVWPLAAGIAALPLAVSGLRRPGPPRSSGARLAAGYGLLLVSFFAATRIEPPELTSMGQGSWRTLADLTGLTALLVAALAFGADARGARGPGYRRMTAALLSTTAAIGGSLALVSASPFFPAAVLLLAAGCFELWTRAAGAREGEPFVLPRLLAAAALLLVLIVSPLREHTRAAEAFRVASAIRMPDPQRPSTGAVVAAEHAADRIARFDLERDLPAPLGQTDLSDLAYRIWREGAGRPGGDALIAYEVFDAADRSRSGFSLIPESESPAEEAASSVRIDRYRVAMVRRRVPLFSGGRAWGSVLVEVADWPSWDPLPPRIGVYRSLVLGSEVKAQSPAPARPLLALYALSGQRREEGPALSAALLSKLRRADGPVRARFSYRGQELRGEIRLLPDGYRLIAIPGPLFFGRLLTAALLLPGIAMAFLAGALLLLWRMAVRERGKRLLPRWARTFRGRLVALFVVAVMIPLVAVSFFLRRQIQTHSERDTLDHARVALLTARRVLDDYLPSAAAGRGRLGLLDDTLIAWLANAVGYDLSVYGPDGGLVATSRRDLYASGLVPDRAPASIYVAVGLGSTRRQRGSRLVAGSRFEEVTEALAAVPGIRGLSSPGLISVLLLPQQQVAAAEHSELIGAVWAFSLLAFLFSAAVAGRLAVRVARPLADLVEGTRAVARGDFSPSLSEPPDEELKELVRAFLSMSQSLKERTEAVSREKERLATLLSHLTAGVVALGEGGRVLLANPAAVALGGGSAAAETLDGLFPGEALRGVRAALCERSDRAVTMELEPRPGTRWRIVSLPLPLGGEEDRMAVVEDISDVVRSNRLSAWAEMARIIAHEIKNPLTPIRLSVEHLREVWRRGSPDFGRVLEECVGNVLRQTEELRLSAAEFSDYARLPRPEIRSVDVGRALREAAAAYAGAPGIRWTLEVRPEVMAEADPRLLARAFANLIANAVEALGESGGAVRLTLAAGENRAVATVEDDGPGVAPEILPRLFDPYFSARSGGTGLGLAIVKKIVEEHGGAISAENRPEGGFRVRLDLPLSRAARPAPAGTPVP